MSEQEQAKEQAEEQTKQQEQTPEYAFHPADLVEYAMDKPIGAARAALAIGLEDTDVNSGLIIDELVGNMELNQRFLKKLTRALRKDPSKIIEEMPDCIKALQVEGDLGL